MHELNLNRLIKSAGTRKRADSYFPPEERVRLVRLVSNWVLPGEKSGESYNVSISYRRCDIQAELATRNHSKELHIIPYDGPYH